MGDDRGLSFSNFPLNVFYAEHQCILNMLLRRALGFTNISCYHIVCVTTFTSYSINDSSYNNYIFIFIYSENCNHRLPSQQQYPLNNNSFW